MQERDVVSDMAVFVSVVERGSLAAAARRTGLTPSYPNVKNLVDGITQRPAAQRAMKLEERLSLKSDFDDEARRALFPLTTP